MPLDSFESVYNLLIKIQKNLACCFFSYHKFSLIYLAVFITQWWFCDLNNLMTNNFLFWFWENLLVHFGINQVLAVLFCYCKQMTYENEHFETWRIFIAERVQTFAGITVANGQSQNCVLRWLTFANGWPPHLAGINFFYNQFSEFFLLIRILD